MAKKNTRAKTVKKDSKKKTHIKSNARARSENKVKETIRVKTFIVEKPVYVEAPSRFQRLRQRLPKYSGEESRYSRRREEDFEEDFDEHDQKKESTKANKEYLDDDYSATQGNEPLEGEEAFEESGEFDESLDETGETPQATGGHLRSRGLFNNVWWKKGMLKGFFLWVVIVIFVYLLDILGMAQVVDAKRWLFFLVLLLILGMGYQKYLSGKVSF